MNKKILHQLISCIDLTSLNNLDNEITISKLVKQANEGIENYYPAAVCVFSNFGDFVSKNLKTEIKTAVVAGNFPTGQGLSTVKKNELNVIANTDVDEVDIVINRGELIAGNYEYVLNEIIAAKKIIQKRCLKVIIESGELNPEQISKAAEISIQGGADFVKTSTGKIDVGATEEAVKLICQVIANEFQNNGKKIGIKISGGIRTVEDALIYYSIVEGTLGKEWLCPELFRIGASSLFDNIKDKFSVS